ncbi:MAG: class A beta-lactamase [Acidobacteriia bacterium]|nr:class A beta-lactamase [Terriglobia bacterium]
MAGNLGAATKSLLREWLEIAQETDGIVGAAALHLSSGMIVSMNGDERFPLASVCKLPIAMHILASADEGKLSLEESIEVEARDVWAGVSDIAKVWPAQRRFPLSQLISLMVAHSDNTAEETLFRIGGGGHAMAARLRQWKVNGVRVDRSERQCDLDRNGVEQYPPQTEWTDSLIKALIAKSPAATRYRATKHYLADPRDTGTPRGTAQLLARAFRGELLAPASTARLIAILKSTTTFPTRLKGILPPRIIVAHKTGSAGPASGFAAATNDSGVIFLPDGGQLAVSVYIKASTRKDAIRDRVIARVSRAAFDAWT